MRLLALATVLVFAVTRVIFIPQGEFVAYGALTLALLQLGKVPGTVWLLLGAGAARGACSTLVDALRRGLPARAMRCAALARTLVGAGRRRRAHVVGRAAEAAPAAAERC